MIRTARLLTLLLLLIPALALAQEPTRVPQLIPLTVGETVAGSLHREADEHTYSFDIPQGHDVMVVVEADKVVMLHYCVEISAAEGNNRRECPGYGGSGDDGPVTRQLYIAGDADPNTQHKVELWIVRPFAGEANYTLNVYPMALQSMTFGSDIVWHPDDQTGEDQQFHVYALHADPMLPFTVEIEDTAEDGNFLWAAHEPYQVDFSAQESRLLVPRFLDGASNDEAKHGVKLLSLHYLGGDEFRVVVSADDEYTLHSRQLNYQPLDAGMPVTVTLSYRDPIRVLRLSNDTAGAPSVSVSVADGVGALVRAYTSNDPYGQGIALGETYNPDADFPLSATLDLAPSTRPVVLVLQVPFEFTRSSVIMQVLWRRST